MIIISGISSIVFSEQKPFHPERLFNLLSSFKDGIKSNEKSIMQCLVRCKGFLWLGEHHHHHYHYHHYHHNYHYHYHIS